MHNIHNSNVCGYFPLARALDARFSFERIAIITLRHNFRISHLHISRGPKNRKMKRAHASCIAQGRTADVLNANAINFPDGDNSSGKFLLCNEIQVHVSLCSKRQIFIWGAEVAPSSPSSSSRSGPTAIALNSSSTLQVSCNRRIVMSFSDPDAIITIFRNLFQPKNGQFQHYSVHSIGGAFQHSERT